MSIKTFLTFSETTIEDYYVKDIFLSASLQFMKASFNMIFIHKILKSNILAVDMNCLSYFPRDRYYYMQAVSIFHFCQKLMESNRPFLRTLATQFIMNFYCVDNATRHIQVTVDTLLRVSQFQATGSNLVLSKSYSLFLNFNKT